MAHQSFKRAQNLDPIDFDVPGAGDEVIHFDCEDEIPSGVVLAFTDVVGGGGDPDDAEGAGSNLIVAVEDLFKAAVVESQVEQILELIHSKDKTPGKSIPLSMLMDIAMWLAERYTARPTGQSSGSGRSVK